MKSTALDFVLERGMPSKNRSGTLVRVLLVLITAVPTAASAVDFLRCGGMLMALGRQARVEGRDRATEAHDGFRRFRRHVVRYIDDNGAVFFPYKRSSLRPLGSWGRHFVGGNLRGAEFLLEHESDPERLVYATSLRNEEVLPYLSEEAEAERAVREGEAAYWRAFVRNHSACLVAGGAGMTVGSLCGSPPMILLAGLGVVAGVSKPVHLGVQLLFEAFRDHGDLDRMRALAARPEVGRWEFATYVFDVLPEFEWLFDPGTVTPNFVARHWDDFILGVRSPYQDRRKLLVTRLLHVTEGVGGAPLVSLHVMTALSKKPWPVPRLAPEAAPTTATAGALVTYPSP